MSESNKHIIETIYSRNRAPPIGNLMQMNEGFCSLPSLISDSERQLMIDYLSVSKQRYVESNNLTGSNVENDPHHPKTFSFYSPLCAEVALLTLLPKIEAIVSEKIAPSFSYARTYYAGSWLDRHKDRKNASFGLSICLERNSPYWPLVIVDRHGIEHEFDLEEGDGILFTGMELEHYRSTLLHGFQTQMFLFYVPLEQTQTAKMFDGRDGLGEAPTRSVSKEND